MIYSIVVVAEGAKPVGGGVTLKQVATAGLKLVAADDCGVMTARTLGVSFGD
jgi:hypothetical protein